MKKKELLELESAGYQLEMISKTQPQGNVKQHSQYLQFGDGYVACLRVYHYPPHGLPMFWGITLTNTDSTMTMLSIGTEDKDKIKDQLSRSAGEKHSQISGKAKAADNVESANTYNDQMDLLKDIIQRNEIIKKVYFRIFIYAQTKEELEKKIKLFVRKNGQFRMARYADEQLLDFETNLVPTSNQENMINRPSSTPMSAYSLSGSYPFNHVKLEDPRGSYYGYTSTQGEMIWDPFHRDEKRTRSFFFVTGNAGMGKSTLLKKINDDVFARGAIIRNFDISNEYKEQTRSQGGVVIRLDKPDYLINPFEVFATVIDDQGQVDEISSFGQHKEKLKNFFKFLNPDVNSDDLTMFDTWLTDFYITQNLWIKNPQSYSEPLKITGLPHDMYPTLREFVVYANERKRQAERDPRIKLTDVDTTSMNRITSTFMNAEAAQGDMLDGVTRFPDLSGEQVVTFDIQGLHAQGEAIFNAQLYSVLTLLSADIIKNGQKLRKQLADGILDENLISWYYLNIDEVENIINPKFSFGVEFLASMMEQMRKNFCAITMAAPTIKDLIMAGSTHDPYILAVQKIFSLFQIRFFFQISDDDIPRLATALGGSTTADELQSLTKLQRGHCLMNINGDRNIQFKVDLTADEERRYGGGM